MARRDRGAAQCSGLDGGNTGGDTLYAEAQSAVADFAFNAQVVAVFPDMIRRSVPGYETLLSLLGSVARQHLQSQRATQPNAQFVVYDLGCSLGAAMLSIHAALADPNARFIGVDNSAAMLAQCQKNVDALGETAGSAFRLAQHDLSQTEIHAADLVVLNFTLQFLPPAQRLDLLRRIWRGLKPGGLLVLSEKIDFQNQSERATFDALHQTFKRANQYSDLEIAQKRIALEKVMKLDSLPRHRDRLSEAGFGRVNVWFQAFNFASLLAWK